MNIFRMLASGKRGINEENMSACLAWLMHPGMDHGFGPAFLKAFLSEISSSVVSTDAESIKKGLGLIEGKIKHRLRHKSQDHLDIGVDLEYNASGQGFIDVLVSIKDERVNADEWFIAVENKISASSAQNTEQLLGQYRGLCSEHIEAHDEGYISRSRRMMVFLVPPHHNSQSEDDFEKSIMSEWNALTLNELNKDGKKDGKVIVSWRARSSRPSIESAITKMLTDEVNGEIDPFHDHTRHTLLALRRFICEDFEGYPFERKRGAGGQNLATESRLYLHELAEQRDGFVGIHAGVSGVLRHLESGTLQGRDFQFTTQDMSRNRNWLTTKAFLSIVEAAKAGFPNISAILSAAADEKLSLPGDLLRWLADQPGKPDFYVGISGGEAALANMNHADIQGKSWGVSSEKKTQQWIHSTVYSRLYREATERR